MLVNGVSIFGLNGHSTSKVPMKIAFVTKYDHSITPGGDFVANQASNLVTIVPQVIVRSEHVNFKEKHEYLFVVIGKNLIHVSWIWSVRFFSIEEMFTRGLKK